MALTLKFFKKTKKDDGEEETTALDSDDFSSVATASDTSRRGKRRSSDGSIILGRPKRRITRNEEACTESERTIELQARAAEESRRALGLDVGDPRPADALCKQAATDVDLICQVATRSSHLKGTFQRVLKDAAASISQVVEALRERSASDEVRKLQLEISRLRSEMQELKLQNEELRYQRRERTPAISSPIVDLVEEMRASMSGTVQRIIDARFAGLEERLLPAKSHRPPLAADKNREEAQTVPVSGPKKKRKPTPTTAPASGPAPKKVTPNTAATEEGLDGGEWTTVVKKGKKKKKAKTYAAAAAAAPTPQRKPKQQTRPKKARKPRLAIPRAPAVLITLEEYSVSKGITYCHLLERAAETVNLADLGIDGGLNIRRAATGARLLELPKGQTPEVAKRLAEELQTAFGSLARVVQPMKLASLRVSGLDDSVTSEAVATAVAKVGKCDAGDVKVGAIAVGPGGLGGTVVRCPIPAAKALAEARRLLVGWSSARVQVLEQRPMRCFKCMGIGHTRPTCLAAVDRRGACYRCGVEGHIARNCTGALRCAVCADAGKPASHIMGGRECRPQNRGLERRRQRPRPLPKAHRTRSRRRLRLCHHDLPQFPRSPVPGAAEIERSRCPRALYDRRRSA
ncbi:unnamed protein product [Euphydryas editha]|uniref:CCHC-type domain-containing protein n=1 Tax=Euphydryas editha TaxID=104508 RepID=A0AAU9U1E6_EUPED|nr:unnamed protein product [Euphydryas editha]